VFELPVRSQSWFLQAFKCGDYDPIVTSDAKTYGPSWSPFPPTPLSPLFDNDTHHFARNLKIPRMIVPESYDTQMHHYYTPHEADRVFGANLEAFSADPRRPNVSMKTREHCQHALLQWCVQYCTSRSGWVVTSVRRQTCYAKPSRGR
jgi:hypothetical protein